MDPPDSGLKEEGLVFPSQGSGGSLGEVPALGSRYGGPREDKAGGLVHVSSSVRNTDTPHPWRGIKRGQNLNVCEEKKPEEEGPGGGRGAQNVAGMERLGQRTPSALIRSCSGT